MTEHILFDNYPSADVDTYDYESAWRDIVANCRGVKTNQIICIADLGLWNGRHSAYKLLGEGLANALYVGRDCEYIKFYIDGKGNFRSSQTHHDGTNKLLFREIKDGVTETAIRNFCSKIYQGSISSADIARYTKAIGHYFYEYMGLDVVYRLEAYNKDYDVYTTIKKGNYFPMLQKLGEKYKRQLEADKLLYTASDGQKEPYDYLQIVDDSRENDVYWRSHN